MWLYQGDRERDLIVCINVCAYVSVSPCVSQCMSALTEPLAARRCSIPPRARQCEAEQQQQQRRKTPPPPPLLKMATPFLVSHVFSRSRNDGKLGDRFAANDFSHLPPPPRPRRCKVASSLSSCHSRQSSRQRLLPV